MIRTFDFLIDKNFKSVQTASFEVPSFCSRLCIQHDILKEIANVTVLVVFDTQKRIRLQKQLGCSEPVLGIGTENSETTIGGIPGEIEAGEWTIKLYLPMEYIKQYLKEEKVPFKLIVSNDQIEISENLGENLWVNKDFEYSNYDVNKEYKSGKRWYKGDFHTHTRLSDGKELPENVMNKAKLMNLDFYTATEHNVMHTGWLDTQVLVLPGVEVTTILGHANLFDFGKRPDFLDDILEYDCNMEVLPELWDRIVEWCKNNNVLFSINHPFLYKWKWLYDAMPLNKVSCLEIINDPTYEAVEIAHGKEANELSVKLSDLLWSEGYRICAIGGSDSHNRIDEFYDGATEPSIAGDPATWLMMENLSAQNVYKTLRIQRVCVTRYIEEFEIDLSVNGKALYPGDKIDDDVNVISWRIQIKSKSHKPDLFYIQNDIKKELILQEKAEGVYEGEGSIELVQADYNWIRFGAVGENEVFMLYTNPIVRGSKTPSIHTFKEAKEKLGI